MPPILRTCLPLFFLLLIFIVLKIPHLFYPHYWDETGSYAPAVHSMYKHGVTLLPGALPADVTRGHPLFFYAAAATWMKIFGSSLISQHAFALFVSVLLLCIVYVAGYKLFNQRVAIIATILLAAQIMFFVQSAMVLPEVLVALLAFATIYFYAIERFFIAFVCLSLLFLTKESGFVMGILLGADVCGALFNRHIERSVKYKKAMTVIGAGLVIVTFFLVQHHAYSWFLYPEHTGLIDYSWYSVFEKFKNSMFLLLSDDKMYRVFWLLLLLSLVIAIRKRQFIWLIYFVPAFFIWRLVTNKTFFNNYILLSVTAVSLAGSILFSVRLWGEKERAKKLLLLGGVFFLLYVTFCIFNFFTVRYLLTALVWVVFFIAVWLDRLVTQTSLYWYIPITALLAVNAAKAYQYDTDLGDCNFQAFNAMKMQMDVVRFLEQKQLYKASIGLGDYQQCVNLQYPYLGVLQGHTAFGHVAYDIKPQTDIAIFDNVEDDYRYAQIKTDSNFHCVYRTQHGAAWGEVYFNKRMKRLN